MKYEDCIYKHKCKYCQKYHPMDKYGRFLKGYYVCNCLPYWLKPLDNIRICPKKEYGDDAGTLKTICKVNTR